jgi:hypothetical protein
MAAAGGDRAAEYARKAAEVDPGDAEARFRLALWCEENGLRAEALLEHRAVVVLDADHRASRRALGFERVNGRWVKGDEAMREKGFVEFEGRWITPEEYALYAKDEIAAKAAREARTRADAALKLAWNADAAVRARAMGAIEDLEPQHRLRPLSIATRIKHPDVRLRAVGGLGALQSREALPPLYKAAIFDADESIRRAAVEAVKGIPAEGKIGPFVGALRSPFDPVRLHAIEALGWMGDPDAVGPLVARFEVAGGSGQSVYISSMNQISYVQDFDVEVAQTSFIADPVIGVIQDGLTLNFRALAINGYFEVYEKPALRGALKTLTGKDLGDTPSDWAKWWREQQKGQ